MEDATLTDAQYHRLAADALAAVELQVDRWLDDDTIDIDTHRSGGLLELSFPNSSKMILNTQPPLQEIWLAAKAGGFHFRWSGHQWLDTREGSELFARLSHEASAQAGCSLKFEPPRR